MVELEKFPQFYKITNVNLMGMLFLNQKLKLTLYINQEGLQEKRSWNESIL